MQGRLRCTCSRQWLPCPQALQSLPNHDKAWLPCSPS